MQTVSSKKINIAQLRSDYGGLTIEMPCKVAFVGENSYGKFPRANAPEQVIMEYGSMLRHMANYLPKTLNNNEDFKQYLKDSGVVQADPKKELTTNKFYSMADYIMVTLPDPRVKYYQSSNFYEIQARVTSHASEIIESLGFFPVGMEMAVLE